MLNLIARMPPAAPWKEGNAVALDMRASQISLFDTGGRRIEVPQGGKDADRAPDPAG